MKNYGNLEFVRTGTGTVRVIGAAALAEPAPRWAADLHVPEETFWNNKRPAISDRWMEQDETNSQANRVTWNQQNKTEGRKYGQLVWLEVIDFKHEH